MESKHGTKETMYDHVGKKSKSVAKTEALKKKKGPLDEPSVLKLRPCKECGGKTHYDHAKYLRNMDRQRFGHGDYEKE